MLRKVVASHLAANAIMMAHRAAARRPGSACRAVQPPVRPPFVTGRKPVHQRTQFRLGVRTSGSEFGLSKRLDEWAEPAQARAAERINPIVLFVF